MRVRLPRRRPGASSNGRAAVLQTADAGSIPPAPTSAATIHSPIDGREPAFEAGDVGSTPARGAHGGRCVLACMPRCERGGAGSIPAGHPDRSRALTNGRQPVPKTGVVVMSPRGSTPPLSSDCLTALSANGRRPGPQPGNGGFNSPQRHARPLRLHGKAPRLSIGRRGFESRSGRTHAHGNWIAASATNAGIWRFESSRGYSRRRAGVVIRPVC